MLKVGVIGSGYWGKHHLRIYSQLPCQLVGVADIDPSKKDLAEQYGTGFFTDYRKLLKKVDAVSIVTPPSLHFSLAKKALRQGVHVLLEKPFTQTTKEAKLLSSLVSETRTIVMPGHTYMYHPMIQRMAQLLKEKELGKIYYCLLNWFNLGIIRKDVNALANFGPHPFSILAFLFPQLPKTISVQGVSFIQKNIEDAVFMTLTYEDGMAVQINMSWLHPAKIREVSIVGSKKMAYFDDAQSEAPLKIYDKGIASEEFAKAASWETFSQFRSKIRYGDLEIPQPTDIEPLKEELRDFIECCETGSAPKASITNALGVQVLLEAAQKSLAKGGVRVEIKS